MQPEEPPKGGLGRSPRCGLFQLHRRELNAARKVAKVQVEDVEADLFGLSKFLRARRSQTCPRRRSSLATNERRGGQVGAACYAAVLTKRSPCRRAQRANALRFDMSLGGAPARCGQTLRNGWIVTLA